MLFHYYDLPYFNVFYFIDIIVPTVGDFSSAPSESGYGALYKIVKRRSSFSPIAAFVSISAANHMTGTLAILLSQPLIYSMPQPMVQSIQVGCCLGGITIIVTPAPYDRVDLPQ